MAAVLLDTSFSFSKSGEYFCHSATDGKLKIWETATGTVKQEYTKNLHLSSPCSCIVWVQSYKTQVIKKRRLSSNVQAVSDDEEIIAVGTTSGSILLYSIGRNSVLADVAAHISRVNCLSSSKSSLFSCSDDKHIAELDLARHKIKSKWKAGKEGVKCILALSSERRLLSASSTIKLWDLDSREVIKTFVGHTSEVFRLLEVPGNEAYFVSAAKGERMLNAWSSYEKGDGGNAVASFLLPDNVASMQVQSEGEVSTLCAISESGLLHIFRHKLNGSAGRPLKPKNNVTVATDDDESKLSTPLHIHSSCIKDDSNIMIVYGNSALLTFESLSLADLREEHIVLVRQGRKKITVDEFNSKIRVPNIGNDVEYLGVSEAVPRQKGKQRDVPLERRLDNLTIAPSSSSDAHKKDNLAHLLLQALQSKDKKFINDVLFRHEDSVVTATVRNLPIQSLYPLLKEITSLLQGKTFTSRVAVRWLSAIMRTHAAVLLANPELKELLDPLLAAIESKVSGLPDLLRLKGRLSLVADQLGTSVDTSSPAEDFQAPLTTYQDNSDSDPESESDSQADSIEESDEFSDVDDDDKTE